MPLTRSVYKGAASVFKALGCVEGVFSKKKKINVTGYKTYVNKKRKSHVKEDVQMLNIHWRQMYLTKDQALLY